MNTGIAHVEARFNNLILSDAQLDRRSRTSTLDKEILAFSELSSILVKAPQQAVQRFLELTVSLCNAGTAGLSLLARDEDGAENLRWEAVAGALAGNEGETVPRKFSLCGLCLDNGAPIVVSRPERVFKYFRKFRPSISEALLVPLYDHAQEPLGAIWIARHDASHFGADDTRIVGQLAIQLVLALKLIRIQRDHGAALDLIASYEPQQRKAAAELAGESGRRQVAEQSERGLAAKLEFNSAAVREVDHRAKNTLQIVGNVLAIQSRTTSSREVREALQEAYRRLHVLAKLHELLYMSDGATREVQMLPLFVSLGDALRQSFSERSADIRLRVAVEPLKFPESVAIPLALLANELVTNAYKHAFPHGLRGTIELTLKRAPEGIVLQVSDNGIGVRSKGESGGIGHTLVRSFSTHLKGTLVYSEPTEGGGIIATLTIHPPEKIIDEKESAHSRVDSVGASSSRQQSGNEHSVISS